MIFSFWMAYSASVRSTDLKMTQLDEEENRMLTAVDDNLNER